MQKPARQLPTETINGLKPPLPEFPYFSAADEFRFEADATTHSAVNAWWLADASFLVYGDFGFIRDAFDQSPLPSLGFNAKPLGDENNNRGMILSSDDALVIVFRGTRMNEHKIFDAAAFVAIDPNDLVTDSKFIPKNFDAGGKVHGGFLAAYEEVRGLLAETVKAKPPAQKLWFTGHSLGGALASLAAADFADETAGLYTYGAPRAGNSDFAKRIPNNKHIRYVHRDDWVPTVPPEFIGYWHSGQMMKVPGTQPRRVLEDLSVGTQSFLSAVKTMAKEMKIDFGDFPMKIHGVSDHAPVYYATHLWNALIEN